MERLLLYNPDAVALWLYQKYTALFDGVLLNTQLRAARTLRDAVGHAGLLRLDVCRRHALKSTGIQATTSSPFSAWRRCSTPLWPPAKPPAIVSTEGDSISKSLERDSDYFIIKRPTNATAKSAELIELGRHRLITVYNRNFDGTMHRHGRRPGIARGAALTTPPPSRADRDGAARLGGTLCRRFLPDHGCHEIDGGCGSHGLDMPEDMNIVHFYGLRHPMGAARAGANPELRKKRQI